MSRLDTVDVHWSLEVRGFETRRIADCIFAIGFFVAVFAAEIAIVQFAGPTPPVTRDEQVVVLPIT